MKKYVMDLEHTHVDLLLTREEAARYWEVFNAARKRNPLFNKAQAARELLGMEPAVGFTAEEMEYFRTGIKQGIEKLFDIPAHKEERRKTG